MNRGCQDQTTQDAEPLTAAKWHWRKKRDLFSTGWLIFEVIARRDFVTCNIPGVECMGPQTARLSQKPGKEVTCNNQTITVLQMVSLLNAWIILPIAKRLEFNIAVVFWTGQESPWSVLAACLISG